MPDSELYPVALPAPRRPALSGSQEWQKSPRVDMGASERDREPVGDHKNEWRQRAMMVIFELCKDYLA